MRKTILALMTVLAAGTASMVGSAPAAAYDYPYCLQGRGVGFYNAEIRYRFIDFKFLKQNWGIAVSAFNDGAHVFVPYALTNATGAYPEAFSKYVSASSPDSYHFSVGGGLRLIMNRNFIVCCEIGHCLNPQDNNKTMTIDLNTDWLF